MHKSTKQKSKMESVGAGQKGFTIIELVVVVVIVTIVAAIVIARFQSAIKKSNEASAVSAVKLIVNVEVTKKYSGGYANFEQMINEGALDTAFRDDDADPLTASRSGYLFKLTLTADDFVVSAIPSSTGLMATGNWRLGADNTGILYRDENNLTTHYSTAGELRSGTSVPYDSN